MGFKLATFSDLHIGYASTRHADSQRINLRVRDGYKAAAQAIAQMIEQEVDAVLVPGDIFHVPEPKIRDIIFIQNQLRLLAAAGIAVYLLSGNHDSLDVAHEIAASRVLDDPLRKIHSEYAPYVTHEIADGILVHMLSHHLFSEQSDTMKKVVAEKGAINILSAHGSTIDPFTKMKLHTEQSPREIVIPDTLLKENEWDYVMLGHIHERGWVGSRDKKNDTAKRKIFYNGSLIRRGFSDKDVPLGKGWTLWDIEPNGKFTPKFFEIDQRAQEDFKTIDAQNLKSSDITELIVKNLSGSHGYGEGFLEESAPILRQQIVNLNPAKHQSLDWKTIEANSKHALQWSLKTTIDAPETTEVVDGEKIVVTESGDIMKVYDDWVDKSEAITRVSKDHKGLVVDQGRKYIRSGQDGVLDES